jgi:hypothetical protein
MPKRQCLLREWIFSAGAVMWHSSSLMKRLTVISRIRVLPEIDSRMPAKYYWRNNNLTNAVWHAALLNAWFE